MNLNIKNGDSMELLKTIPSNSVDCMVTDPPYGISFMSKDWDKAVPDVAIWKECLRVMKPGAFAFVMCSPRSDVQAEMVIKLKEAGFDVGFTPIYWVYASGFPKAMNISKAVDRKLGYEREITGIGQNFGRADSGIYQMNVNGENKHVFQRKDEPISEEAQRLDGSYAGYQPKPAVEVIIVAMKPLSEKTYVDQALKNGKGITWLDDGRIPYQSEKDKNSAVWGNDFNVRNTEYEGGWESRGKNLLASNEGRFPANLLVQDNALDIGVNKISRVLDISKLPPVGKNGIYGNYKEQTCLRGYEDSGDLSRYFSLDAWYSKNIEELPDYIQRIFPFLYVPKASSGERNEDLENLTDGIHGHGNLGNSKGLERFNSIAKNIHPTVKPLKLMTYIITIGSRPGDTILDPFLGSGTTGVAAAILNRNFIGFEINESYFEIAENRIKARQTQSVIEAYFNDNGGSE